MLTVPPAVIALLTVTVLPLNVSAPDDIVPPTVNAPVEVIDSVLEPLIVPVLAVPPAVTFNVFVPNVIVSPLFV
jgi:hypothetical protein